MPAIKLPPSFPGIDSLPSPLKGLSEMIFPQSQGAEAMAPTPLSSVVETSSRGAIRELLDIIKSYKKDPMAELAGSIISHRVPASTTIKAPSGFEFANGTPHMQVRRAPGLNQARKLQAAVNNPRRGLVPSNTPSVQSIDELANLPVQPTQAQPKTLSPKREVQQGPNTQRASAGFTKIDPRSMSPEMIVEIQKMAGSGLKSQNEITQAYPNLTRETINKVLKMPWKW